MKYKYAEYIQYEYVCSYEFKTSQYMGGFFFFAESPEPDRHICSSRGIFHLHRSKAHISETRFPIENPSLKSTSEFPGQYRFASVSCHFDTNMAATLALHPVFKYKVEIPNVPNRNEESTQ